ncbi:tRNA 2-thiouridine(34) synthase MnmA [Plebeiibacterium marinum]|uniref:tRNA-specific 2-thiouridylase MnmA n=1 Tax=Plebeiibacterium marinum TaxID=2992111 RepID=A0AAE3SIL2_9BACT|nr:tRNA 2-thiouridine(34) synthase MnmA [Plebeiobacterium marinum]MCW3804815.1 tRNA 2-thiouridine(34) synthase MnmA [Plebeiobacterium marinum]
MAKKRVLLGMSGGIDSSMSAWYLLQKGYEVVGITFNTVSPLSSPESSHFISEAKNLACKLQFDHHVMDVYDDFKKEVIDYFVAEYLKGRTPNPCIRCNETIKWKLLYEEAQKLQCDYIATGHYVRLIKKDGIAYIQKGVDPLKDQSYFLWNLPQRILNKCIFPLGELLKSKIKIQADELGFKSITEKKESMGVCFLHGSDYRDFINEIKPGIKSKLANGNIINQEGEIIGSHEGFPYYTIGQKRGLALKKNHGECVAKIDAENNILITAPKNTLFSTHLKVSEFLSCNPNFLQQVQNVNIRIRGLDYTTPTPGSIELIADKLHINFNKPVWALTPGQSIVFYQDDMVVGGAIVDDMVFDTTV